MARKFGCVKQDFSLPCGIEFFEGLVYEFTGYFRIGALLYYTLDTGPANAPLALSLPQIVEHFTPIKADLAPIAAGMSAEVAAAISMSEEFDHGTTDRLLAARWKQRAPYYSDNVELPA